MGSAEGGDEFCLRWNDFESNISGAFRTLRNDGEFCDVTLACHELEKPSNPGSNAPNFHHRTLNAHKIILSTCSPYFRSLLRQLNSSNYNRGQVPLVVMRGVSYKHLSGILDFMYYGEVNISQSELDAFLALAEELQVKGLTQSDAASGAPAPAPAPSSAPPVEPPPTPAAKKRKMPSNGGSGSGAENTPPVPPFKAVKNEAADDGEEMEDTKPELQDYYEDYGEDGGGDFDAQAEDPGEGPSNYDGNGDEGACSMLQDERLLAMTDDEYRARIKTFIAVVPDGEEEKKKCYSCSVCGHKSKKSNNVFAHLEAVHLNVMRYQCTICSKRFKSRNMKLQHISRNHGEERMKARILGDAL